MKNGAASFLPRLSISFLLRRQLIFKVFALTSAFLCCGSALRNSPFVQNDSNGETDMDLINTNIYYPIDQMAEKNLNPDTQQNGCQSTSFSSLIHLLTFVPSFVQGDPSGWLKTSVDSDLGCSAILPGQVCSTGPQVPKLSELSQLEVLTIMMGHPVVQK